MCDVDGPYLFRQHGGEVFQTFRVRTVRIVAALFLRFVGVIVSGHCLEPGMTVGIIGIINFVSDTPQNDAWMVPVSENHRVEVFAVMLGEILVITLMHGWVHIVSGAPLVFRRLPLVEGLVHDEKAHGVTEIVQLRHMGIVTHTDRVAAHTLQLFQAPDPDFPGYRRSQRSCVVMYADALELQRPAVQEKAMIRIEEERADSHGKRVGEARFAVRVPQPGAEGIQTRTIRRPESRTLQNSAHPAGKGFPGGNLYRIRKFQRADAVFVCETVDDCDGLSGVRGIQNFCLCQDVGVFRRRF